MTTMFAPIFADKVELLNAAASGDFRTIRFNEAVGGTDDVQVPPFGLLYVAVSDSEPSTLSLRDKAGVEQYKLSLGVQTLVELPNGRCLNTTHGDVKFLWTVNPLW